MAQTLESPATTEVSVQKELRAKIVQEIERRHISSDEMANKLSLLPSGVQALMERKVWPIEIALRIAERLDIELNLKLE